MVGYDLVDDFSQEKSVDNIYNYFSSWENSGRYWGESYYNPYMTSFVDKSAYPWELSAYWGRSPYSYPSELALSFSAKDYMVPYDIYTLHRDAMWLDSNLEPSDKYPEWWKSMITESRDKVGTARNYLEYTKSRGVLYGVEKPDNPFDILHPYYRTKVAKYVVPAIFIAGLGFVAWTTYVTYFKDPTGGKWTKKDRKTNLKKLWTNMQGGFLGGAAFGIFLLLLVSLQMWTKGLSLPKTIKYFGEQAQVAAGISKLER